ncbi:hypothetical protein ACJJID_08870 [Microbulbifer sp. CnH-101-G]|uniref:hypothetical protein n=1 Tax=Microbulbifer sp. CnH-101-G TaxID=3243393 RepID=UPI0040390AE8
MLKFLLTLITANGSLARMHADVNIKKGEFTQLIEFVVRVPVIYMVELVAEPCQGMRSNIPE